MKTLSTRRSVLSSLIAAVGAFCVTSVSLALVPGPQKNYTLDADFDLGLLFNVNHNSPNNNQLQLSQQIGTFPLLWVANAGEDTVSKIDTNTGKEIGRYRTWSDVGLHGPWSGPAPSRTAVDADGNCYVLNRHFDGNPAMVIKILAGSYVDRNSNGVMDTCVDTNNDGRVMGAEVKPFLGVNHANNDERIAWMTQVGGGNGIGRSLAIAPDGKIWVGLFNHMVYYKLDPTTGAILAGPISSGPSNRPYGSAIDASGILWGAGWDSHYFLKLDTSTGTATNYYQPYTYGIGYYGGIVYMGGYPGYNIRRFNVASSTFSDVTTGGRGAYAVSTASNGDILFHGYTSGWGAGASRVRPDGSYVWSVPNQAGAGDGAGRGCVPDSNGDVWTINLDTSNVQKFRGSDGAPLGVFPVGLSPYTYSDATGSTFVQTIGLGKWTVVLDAGANTTTNAVISWNATVPSGALLTVKAAASNVKSTPGAYVPADFVQTMGNGGTSTQTGRYQAVEVTFTAAPSDSASPILLDLKIKCPDVCPPLDINKDGWIDSTDQALILAGVRTRSKDLYLDVNCDGKVDIADSRYIALRYTR